MVTVKKFMLIGRIQSHFRADKEFGKKLEQNAH